VIALAIDNTRVLEATALFGHRLDQLVLWAWLRGAKVDPWYPRTYSAVLAANSNGGK